MSFGAAFFADPSAPPDPASAPAFGDRAVTLDFAGGPYVLAGLDDASAAAVAEHYAPLCVAAASDDAVQLSFRRADAAVFAPVETRGWEYRFDIVCERDRIELAGWEVSATMAVPPGALIVATAVGPERLLGVIDNALRLAIAYRLLDRGGALLHSAAIVSRGRAHVFVGRSGAGKSTLCRLSAGGGRTILSDELNCLRVTEDGVVVEKLPFAGDYGGPPGARAVYPVAGIYRLEQGPTEALGPLRPSRAFGTLVAAAPFVNGDPHRNARLLRNLEALARALPLRSLAFSLAGAVWPILDGT